MHESKSDQWQKNQLIQETDREHLWLFKNPRKVSSPETKTERKHYKGKNKWKNDIKKHVLSMQT